MKATTEFIQVCFHRLYYSKGVSYYCSPLATRDAQGFKRTMGFTEKKEEVSGQSLISQCPIWEGLSLSVGVFGSDMEVGGMDSGQGAS